MMFDKRILNEFIKHVVFKNNNVWNLNKYMTLETTAGASNEVKPSLIIIIVWL